MRRETSWERGPKRPPFLLVGGMAERFFYGGQALVEGVMVRGRTGVHLAVRRPDGTIHRERLPLPSFARSALRRVPLVRGVAVLAEALVVGTRALMRSAQVAGGEEEGPLSPWAVGGVVLLSLALGLALFLFLPLLGARSLEPWLPWAPLAHLVEGVFRVALLLGYLLLIGRMADVRRVFAYHGAEHMAIHAYEHGAPLEPSAVERFPTAHPRCGTAFLLLVVVVSVFVFALLGRPGLLWGLVGRLLLVPAVAGVSYEILRLVGASPSAPLARLVALPGLLLQRLTTRRPDRAQIEVALAALRDALQADGRAPDPGPEGGVGRCRGVLG